MHAYGAFKKEKNNLLTKKKKFQKKCYFAFDVLINLKWQQKNLNLLKKKK